MHITSCNYCGNHNELNLAFRSQDKHVRSISMAMQITFFQLAPEFYSTIAIGWMVKMVKWLITFTYNDSICLNQKKKCATAAHTVCLQVSLVSFVPTISELSAK